MSHFAKVLNGTVVQVIAAEPDFFNTFVDSSPGEWVQTSYSNHLNIEQLNTRFILNTGHYEYPVFKW